MSTPNIIVIFGISGDLSKRKLLPALYHLLSQDLLDPATKIVGTSRRKLNKSDLLKQVELCVLEELGECDPKGLKLIEDALEIIELDPKNDNDYDKLKHQLDSYDNEKAKRDRMMYMAIPPDAYGEIIDKLGTKKLNDARTRLLIEKPFGEDTASAKKLIDILQEHFNEHQIYRIDHYLAKETAQNLLTFRMHNPIFAPLWNGEHISSVHVKATESIGVENRIDFYEKTGAMRDIIQGHLLQLLAIIMMDQPADDSSMSIHEGKEAFLASIAPADPALAVRGQYDDYKKEIGNPDSFVETFARLELKSELARWQDTKIILETGKGMRQKKTEIMVEFVYQHERRRNHLHFNLQPEEGISLDLVVKQPGFENSTTRAKLDFSYQQAFGDRPLHPDAYERVIIDAARGDRSLFASSREVALSWEIIQPLIDLWTKDGQGLINYEKGSEEVNK